MSRIKMRTTAVLSAVLLLTALFAGPASADHTNVRFEVDGVAVTQVVAGTVVDVIGTRTSTTGNFRTRICRQDGVHYPFADCEAAGAPNWNNFSGNDSGTFVSTPFDTTGLGGVTVGFQVAQETHGMKDLIILEGPACEGATAKACERLGEVADMIQGKREARQAHLDDRGVDVQLPDAPELPELPVVPPEDD